VGVAEIRRLAAVCQAHLAAIKRYQPQPHPGLTVLCQADAGRAGQDRHWTPLCPRLIVESAPGDHYSMLRKPNVAVLAERLEHHLRQYHAVSERTGNP
jgi:thioesterase domain-containing protein